MTSKTNREKGHEAGSFNLKEAILLIWGVPRDPAKRKKREKYLLFRHLALWALAVPIMMWMFGGPALGLTNPWLLLIGVLYGCIVLVWAFRGVRFIAYVGLQALGSTVVSVLSLWSSLKISNAADQKNMSIVLLIGYLTAILALGIVGTRRLQRKGVTGFLARPINWRQGTYDLGKLVAFYRDTDLGQVETSELMDAKDRAGMRKWGWVIYLLLFLAPIAVAAIITRSIGGEFLPLIFYVMSLVMGFSAVGLWLLYNWFWQWEREHSRPMLVKQFTHRYYRNRKK